jgi:MFS family permease
MVSQAGDKKKKFFYGYILVAAALLIVIIAHGAQYTFGIFFKPLVTDFGWTSAATSGAFSLYLVLWGFLSIFVGRLNDKLGPRIVMTVCGFFLGLGYLLMSQIGAIWQLYLFYGVIIAIGMSGGWVPLISTIPRWFVKRRGMMTGIVTSGSGIGTILLSLVASRLISDHGWSVSYIVLGSGVLVLLMLAAQFLRRDPLQVGQLPYGDNVEKERDSELPEVGFCFREAVSTGPFWMVCAIFFCFGFDLYTIMVHIVPHAIELKISPISAASIIAVIGGVNAAGRVIIGSAGDRIGNKRCLIISFVLLVAALLWVMEAREIWMFYLFAVIFGIGYGGLAALMSPVPAELFGLRSLGTIVGAVMFSFTIGGAIGPVLAGSIFDMTGSYDRAFWACTAVGVAGIILSVLLRPPSGQGGAYDAGRSA